MKVKGKGAEWGNQVTAMSLKRWQGGRRGSQGQLRLRKCSCPGLFPMAVSSSAMHPLLWPPSRGRSRRTDTILWSCVITLRVASALVAGLTGVMALSENDEETSEHYLNG